MPELQQGRYPGFDVMDERQAWDPVTRSLVAARLRPSPPKTLTAAEARTLEAVARQLLAEERTEVLAFVVAHVDGKLRNSRGEGQREAGVPPEPQLVKQGLRVLDGAARGGFADLEASAQRALLSDLAQGRLEPPEADLTALPDLAADLPQKPLFQKLLGLCVEALASHPALWSEMGYAGPAYPRGYYRMGRGILDPWEPKPAKKGRTAGPDGRSQERG